MTKSEGMTKSQLTILKEPFQLPPLPLGGAAESFGKMQRRRQFFFARAGVLFGRRQILEEPAYEFGAHALVQQRQHFDGAPDASGQGGDLLAHSDVARRLHVVAANLDMP